MTRKEVINLAQSGYAAFLIDQIRSELQEVNSGRADKETEECLDRHIQEVISIAR